ncbi:hypothetical protein Salat_1145900 [Sesamum alatum]|uniref:Uncharacterized protein n=1 Tax=Sesamum alatum TaxID=300844 RepID=A0AAE2CN97_9LAMI|nr:hypothetical protein Salat_1145900 [Sesamum alatum]
MALSRSLSSSSLANPNPDGDGMAAPADEDEPAGDEEVGTLTTASASGGQSVACGSTSSPRVLHGHNYNLPPPMALLRPEFGPMGAPSSPITITEDQNNTLPSNPPAQRIPSQAQAPQPPIFVGSVPLNTNPNSRNISDTITEGFVSPMGLLTGRDSEKAKEQTTLY